MNKTLALTLSAEYMFVFSRAALCACISADEECAAVPREAAGVRKQNLLAHLSPDQQKNFKKGRTWK